MNIEDPQVQAHARAILARRQAAGRKSRSRLRELVNALSPKQMAYVGSDAPRRRLLGSRQSGKSHSIAVDHIVAGFANKCRSLYIAPTSKSARSAVWSKIHAINHEYELGIELREGKFEAIFPNGSTWAFEGAHDMARVQRLRGDTITGKATIDESGFFSDRILGELLGPVAIAMFLTTTQRIAVSSSPALQRRGRFFDLGSSPEWEQHRLTAHDNPAIKDVARALKELRDASAWTETTPAYLREGLGIEVDDATHNVYELNDLNLIDSLPTNGEWTTIMTYDFGKNDQSAICVAGWQEHDPALYVCHVEGHSDIDIEDMCQLALPLIERWKPIAHYGDAGGGGAQHMDYMRKRHKIGVRPVAKSQHYKAPAIAALNADMRRGRFRVLRHSPLVEQMQALQWDPSHIGEREHPSMPNDLCDVSMYSHVQARHYRAEPRPDDAPVYGTAEALRVKAHDDIRDAIERANKHKAEQDEAAEDLNFLLGE